MFAWKTSQNSTIRLIKVGITNCYFIESDGITILVDTGQKRRSTNLITTLNAYLAGNSLDYLVLTHTHYDHAENSKLIKERYSPQLIVHQTESDFLRKGFTKLPKGTNLISKIISNSGNKYASWIGKYEPVEPDILVDDSYNIRAGNQLKLIHTPGHTIGSLSILVNDELAIVGDTLFGIFPNKILPPFADDEVELKRSWKKLSYTSCRLFLPAHGKIIKRELLEKHIN